ncbi:aldehyde dehydrogenase family protein, partial [Janthinobacterium sp.]|uniref:aldehyde dehydrogenase family protein n=1 Tax=Janthinobacterium sp. TaxID=1871054 RepID=UPI00293D4834
MRALCDEHGSLLIADEIQSGFARTGKLFAMEHYDVPPDLIAVPRIAEVRGLGAMVAVEFCAPGTRDADSDFTKRVQACALQKGLLLLTCGVYGNVIRFLFPLTISDALMEEAPNILEAALRASAPLFEPRITMLNLNDPSLLRQQCYIGGEWLNADNGERTEVKNPATGETMGSIPTMGAAETRRAIDAAARAFPAWAAKTAKERAIILRRWFDLLMANQEDLAVLMTAEQGKPLAESKGEIAYAASFIEWFAEEGKRLYGDVIPGHQADKRLVVIRQPVGV